MRGVPGSQLALDLMMGCIFAHPQRRISGAMRFLAKIMLNGTRHVGGRTFIVEAPYLESGWKGFPHQI